MRNVEPGFAIVRIDPYQPHDQNRFTVKRVVWSEEHAESEVRRLNELKADSDSFYLWQYTRVDGRDSGDPAQADTTVDATAPPEPPATPGIGSPETRGGSGFFRTRTRGEAPPPPPPIPGIGRPEISHGPRRRHWIWRLTAGRPAPPPPPRPGIGKPETRGGAGREQK